MHSAVFQRMPWTGAYIRSIQLLYLLPIVVSSPMYERIIVTDQAHPLPFIKP